MVRQATPDDLDAIVALTAASRRRLAAWAPVWWRPAPAADELHPLWLARLIESEGPVVRVATDGDGVVGCAVSMPQPQQWFVDDVAMADDDYWSDAGVELLEAITERPALTCVPTAHLARRATSLAAGLHHASSYWIRATTSGTSGVPPPLEPGTAIPPAAPHTFGGELDPWTDGALTFGDDDGGLVVGSPPVFAPPVYDAAGPVCVVDRVVGHAVPLLERALAASGARGDVLLAVVANVSDRPLRSALQDLDFVRTVDVFTWPPVRTMRS
ncbi:MAG: hypothetical protein ACRDZU_00420 [Acidimicrobiales bacterium]